jgi:hypothetical protein
MNTAELWGRLRQAGLVQGELSETESAHSPWFVRVMLGVAGWFGALFLLLFVGLGLEFIIKSSSASLVAGAVACAGAGVLFRKFPENDFAGQFGLEVPGPCVWPTLCVCWTGRSARCLDPRTVRRRRRDEAAPPSQS